jgi:hypothetical protein
MTERDSGSGNLWQGDTLQQGETGEEGRGQERGRLRDESEDALDDIIREVRMKHGIAVSQDDPILMVYTINRKVMEASISIQSALLEECRREWEATAIRIQEEAAAGLEQRTREVAMAGRLQLHEVAEQLGREQRRLEEEASRQVLEGLRRWQNLASAHLALSCLLLGAAAMVLWVAA